MKLTILAILVTAVSAFAPQTSTTYSTGLKAEESGRREFFNQAASQVAAAAAIVATAAPANAVRDYENIAYLGGSNTVDINNANVRAYLKMPGMYPGAAGKIVTHGPYSKVSDLYEIDNLTPGEKDVIKKYSDRFVALKPSPDFVIDRVNNGLYR